MSFLQFLVCCSSHARLSDSCSLRSAGMRLTQDRKGAVFDIPVADLKKVQDCKGDS